MTDSEEIKVISKILKRAQAGEFGKVNGMKPGLHVKLRPLSVQMGDLYLGAVKAVALAEGKLTIEPRALGWVLVGSIAPVPVLVRRKPAKRKRLTQERRRAQYLQETGRDTLYRKGA